MVNLSWITSWRISVSEAVTRSSRWSVKKSRELEHFSDKSRASFALDGTGPASLEAEPDVVPTRIQAADVSIMQSGSPHAHSGSSNPGDHA